MKVLSRMNAARITCIVACAIMIVTSVAFTATAMAADKAEPYPESLQKWVDGGKYMKVRRLDVFVLQILNILANHISVLVFFKNDWGTKTSRAE